MLEVIKRSSLKIFFGVLSLRRHYFHLFRVYVVTLLYDRTRWSKFDNKLLYFDVTFGSATQCMTGVKKINFWSLSFGLNTSEIGCSPSFNFSFLNSKQIFFFFSFPFIYRYPSWGSTTRVSGDETTQTPRIISICQRRLRFLLCRQILTPVYKYIVCKSSLKLSSSESPPRKKDKLNKNGRVEVRSEGIVIHLYEVVVHVTLLDRLTGPLGGTKSRGVSGGIHLGDSLYPYRGGTETIGDTKRVWKVLWSPKRYGPLTE